MLWYKVYPSPLQVYFPQLKPAVTYVDETIAYDFMDWFTEVGGVSNLLLGVSVLTFAELLDIIIMKIFVCSSSQ
jgi:hypothetical protein